MTEKTDNTLQTNDGILLINDSFDKYTFIANRRHFLALDLDQINLRNDTFCEDDPVIIIQAGLWPNVVTSKITNHLKDD